MLYTNLVPGNHSTTSTGVDDVFVDDVFVGDVLLNSVLLVGGVVHTR